MDFEKIIAKIRAGKTWRFHGGIHPAEHKDESSESPIERLEPASVYIVPVRQHSGDAGTIIVKTSMANRKLRPLKSNRAKIYPTIELVNRMTIVLMPVTKQES